MADITGTTGDDTLVGTDSFDVILGLEGNDILDGKFGADRLEGGIGNDTFFVDSANEVVIENAGEGVDVLYSLVSYAIAQGREVEVLSLYQSATTAINLTGNEFSQTLIGNAGINTLTGGGGTDIFYGLGGNDIYIVDSADDRVIERVGESVRAGFIIGDTVRTSVSYALEAGSEIEFLSTTNETQSQPINLTGNEFDQDITGNQGDNVLIGGGGIDGLFGRGGNDTYFVDNFDDATIDTGGFDVVYASVTYALRFGGRAIEVLSAFQSSTDRVDLTGNELSQSIIGNQGVNVLRSGGGGDTLYGLGGDDTYVVSDADLVVERFGDGYDSVYAARDFTLNPVVEVEFLTTTFVPDGGFTPVRLTGNDYAQTIWGSQGQVSNDVLDGRGGSDTLWGFMGNDVFSFSTGLGTTNVDHIVDFSNAVQNDDSIALEDVIFSGTGAPGSFSANAFFAGTAAQDADDRIIYDQATGNLYFDSDGSGAGAQVLFAVLDNHAVLTSADFVVI